MFLVNYSHSFNDNVKVHKYELKYSWTHRVLSSDPISPFMEGSGSRLDDDEGGGSLILSCSSRSSLRKPWFGNPIALCEEKLVWL